MENKNIITIVVVVALLGLGVWVFKSNSSVGNVFKTYDANGFDAQGFDRTGYNAAGIDKDGYNRDGFNKMGYNKAGFDVNGFNATGFDKSGFDRTGYNTAGYNAAGINKTTGRTKDGYDKNGFDKSGYDAAGNDKKGYNKLGYDMDGYDKNGYDAAGKDRNGYKAIEVMLASLSASQKANIQSLARRAKKDLQLPIFWSHDLSIYDALVEASDAELMYFITDAYQSLDKDMFTARLNSQPDGWNAIAAGRKKSEAYDLVGKVNARIISLAL